MEVQKRNQIHSAKLLKDYSEIQFETELDPRFECPICNNPLKDPVQTGCGHRMCSECIQSLLRNPNFKCPVDNKPLSPKDVYKDVCFKREVTSLKCFCLNHKHGCEWMKELMYLEEHLCQCEYREVPCENVGCKEKVPMKKLRHHMKETCAFKPSACQYCQECVPERDMEAHLQLNCKKFPITCRYCGMTEILRDEEDNHVTNVCEAAEKPCQFKDVGCSFQGASESLNAHYEAQKDEHLKLTVDFMKTRKQQEEELKPWMAKVEETNKSLEKQLSEHRETLTTTTQNVTYQARLSKAEKNISDHKRAISQIRERTERVFEDLNEPFEAQTVQDLELTSESMKIRKQEEEEEEEEEKEEKANESVEKPLSEQRETLASIIQDIIAEHKRLISKLQMRERTLEDAASSKALTQNEFSLQFKEIRIALLDQEDKFHSFERELARDSVVGAGSRSMSSGSLTLDGRLDKNEHQLALHDIQLAEHDLKIQMLQATSYNGTYIWKIDEFSRRIHQSISNNSMILGPTFCLDELKVCLLLDPKVHKNAEGTHLRLLLHVKNELPIPWPSCLLTFELIDANGTGQHNVINTFRPDLNGPYFELVVPPEASDRSTYIKEDTLLIKIIVEKLELSLESEIEPSFAKNDEE